MTDFRVVSAGEVADEIVRRLACNEIPAAIGQAVAEKAKTGERWGQAVIGPGPWELILAYRFKPDGKIVFQLQDCNACPFWEITLRPAEPVPAE